MQKVVLASRNAGKIKEIHAFLAEKNINIIGMADITAEDSDVAETGLTFVENALLKARQACGVANLPAIADDSGLVVPYLNDEPGIYSARYAGEHGNDAANIAKLLKELTDVSAQERQAYFYCAMVYLMSATDPVPIIVTASWHGRILTKTMGTGGFGYDPVFYLDSLQKTAAQLPMSEKNRISHRGQALQLLVKNIQ